MNWRRAFCEQVPTAPSLAERRAIQVDFDRGERLIAAIKIVKVVIQTRREP
jgi:hypothetical protein